MCYQACDRGLKLAVEQQEKERQRIERLAALRVCEAQAKQRRNQIEAAREFCREITSRRYCPECCAEREANRRYCTTCGGATRPIPPAIAFSSAHNEFPDIIYTEGDFKSICEMKATFAELHRGVVSIGTAF